MPLVFQELSEEELLNRFELTESERLIRFGILGAAPLGPVADYVNFGGGLSMEFIWQQENGLGYGGGLGLTFHRRERAFPDDPFPDREDRSSGAIFISGYVSQALIQQSRKRFTAQAQLGYGQFNGANRIDDIDASFLPYRGVDVGLSFNYTFLVGKYAPVPLYATQRTRALGQYHGIVLIAGLRYQWLNNPLASSAYPFFGVGYQFGTTEFRRKD